MIYDVVIFLNDAQLKVVMKVKQQLWQYDWAKKIKRLMTYIHISEYIVNLYKNHIDSTQISKDPGKSSLSVLILNC